MAMDHLQSNAPGLTITELQLHYQKRCLFDQFHLQIPANSWSCLLGPSGIGKTSLLRFIAGLSEPAGLVCHGKIIPSDNQPLQPRLAYLTQHDSLLPWLTVLQNVLIGFRLRGEQIAPSIDRQAQHFLAQAGLAEQADALPAQLSPGMRQRVALLRILIENREVVLMDEPFSAVDPINRFKLQDWTANLLQQRTVVLVTHDPLEALRLGNQIILLQGIPAQPVSIIRPPGSPPRDPTNPAVLHEYAQLLQTLATLDDHSY